MRTSWSHSVPIALPLSLLLAACGGSGAATPGTSTGNAELVSVHYGRLVDVYGLLRNSSGGTTPALYERDVLVGSDVQDERDSDSTRSDAEVLFDFLSADPGTLQLRLLITREIGSQAFAAAYETLGAHTREVAPAAFGQDTSRVPFSVVPRNGALELAFSQPLGIDDTFFYARDPETGLVTGIKNNEAVQILKIVGDPRDQAAAGDFEVVPCRVAVKGHKLVLDPVLLGDEGTQLQAVSNASGLPESSDQTTANIRVALALAGPLRIPTLRADAQRYRDRGELVGTNNSGATSLVRDFRSGNGADATLEIARGFVRDPIPARVVGQIPMLLEAVAPRDDLTALVTIYKGDAGHELDRGDGLRIVGANAATAAVSEILEDPADDRGNPAVTHVTAVVRRTAGLLAADPRLMPGYPADPRSAAGEAWLRANAPKAVVLAEFSADRDDPRWFVTFSPAPLPYADGRTSAPNENVSPSAAAIVRFTKPVDLATVRGLDTFFFATRDVLDRAAIDAFVTAQGIDKAAFRPAKFRTPHLVAAKAFDEDGSQTAIRLQTPLGFWLDETMRTTDDALPFASKKLRYYVHLVAGLEGIRDLSGNPIDFQSTGVRDALVLPFSLDTRKTPSGQPYAADNFAVSVARRLHDVDEDEQPSYYLADEVPKSGANPNAYKAFNLPDLFGAFVLLADGTLQSRPPTRVRRIVDDINQLPPPAQRSTLAWCPQTINGIAQVIVATGGARYGNPLQNPLNPYGCRLQTVWREVDLSLSRTEPFDFNLDVEQIFWAPYTGAPITYDQFDSLSLYLGHSEFRPEPCIDTQSALPSLPSSGLGTSFAGNYVNNPSVTSTRESAPREHPAYLDKTLTIDASLALTEPNGVNRFLPLPRFEKPYFVWRDETVYEQGGGSGVSNDVTNGGASTRAMNPYLLSPFLGGLGRYVVGGSGTNAFAQPTWNSLANYRLSSGGVAETATGGMVGTIALPLLADFWVPPDSAAKPAGNPFVATGYNGWQISLPVTSSQLPNFRAFSAGGLVGGNPVLMDTNKPDWSTATGGYQPNGQKTQWPADNTVYWMMADFVKRQTVVTAGFVEILDPHRMPSNPIVDPRLGPYFGKALPADTLPRFRYDFEPPLTTLPGGTAVIPEFRGAGSVDDLSTGGTGKMPWRAAEDSYWKNLAPLYPNVPDAVNFPLDPLKAGDAHIRKFDDRKIAGVARNTWTYQYNRNLTRYAGDPNALMDARFTSQFAGPNETFLPRDVKYFNWRFLMQGNVDTATAPKLQSFAVSYRFEKAQ